MYRRDLARLLPLVCEGRDDFSERAVPVPLDAVESAALERRDYNPSVLFVHGYVDRVAPAYVYCVDVFERMVGQNFIAARFRKVAVYRVEELALAVERLI